MRISDGTGNSSGKANKTNVWRMYQALNETNADQFAKYDDGVGTSSIKYLAAFGGAFGWGLKRNVIELYKFVCRNYKPDGAEIYGFGFSRGSFTIRVVVSLIINQGLVDFGSEAELHRAARAVYRRFRAEYFPSANPIVMAWRLLRNFGATPPKQNVEELRIRFLGLWDTVDAYGLPIAELKRGIDLYIWPMVFGDKSLSPRVERACHALSLDDERKTFHPLLWDEGAEARLIAQSQVQPGRLTQVWFAGVHSNVGGGYPDDQLSLVSLEWMMQEAMYHGLDLDKNAVMQVSAAKSPYGRLYDSRAGTGVSYRYEPRSVDMRVADSLAHRSIQKANRLRLYRLLAAPAPHPPLDSEEKEILPIIDSSVITRMAFGSDQYAPFNLPGAFWVMTPNGEFMAMNGPSIPKLDKPIERDQTKGEVASAALRNTKRNDAQVETETKTLREAAKTLAHTDDHAIGLVWDTVWWRRAFYFLTVLLTTILATYPWLSDEYALPINAVIPVNVFDLISGSLVGPVVKAVGGSFRVTSPAGRTRRSNIRSSSPQSWLALAVVCWLVKACRRTFATQPV
jgi:uncharacterized protein (DUF2235 family)